ncbi:MAG TPA: glutamine--fructose-6-phosphate transaminase (isomerizing) [Oligoflexia bacterium]|nr:glutamine--fructose-6-phosphate transaminase (isomerizing) [Oligoflexia bacterium]HMR25467.1 glutamine--fructose-6-phosphate transaminase (isomerizing) [Oligoflexia bacterium]
MCGIAGYIGEQNAKDIVINNLKKLEYRGYDSTGIAVLDQDISVIRAKGKLVELEKKLEDESAPGHVGIGHTRWATHGKPSDENAHPHRAEHVVVVHNGIIENYLEIKHNLINNGAQFSSETDTEIIPLLIEYNMQRNGLDFEQAVLSSIAQLKGSFAFAAMSTTEPEKILVAKNASPLIVGIGNNEMFLASDIPALLEYTQDVVILEDHQMAILEKDQLTLKDFNNTELDYQVKKITWSRIAAEKDGHKHFMYKEILEQPRAIADSMRSRISKQAAKVSLSELDGMDTDKFNKIVFCACGTSYHSGLLAKQWFERYLRIPCDVELASEFRYNDPIIDDKTLWVGISQSGETADTLAALHEAKDKAATCLAICNNMDSSIARAADYVLYTQAGPEIGVASTKAFSTQLSVLAMLCVHMLQAKSKDKVSELVHAILHLPEAVQQCIDLNLKLAPLAQKYMQYSSFLFLGRGDAYAIALEGALKLKEISYIHAEAYAAGEMKHGPIALIDQNMPVMAILGEGIHQEKTLSNIEEVKSRDAKVLIVCTEQQVQDLKLDQNYDCLLIPQCHNFIRPILENIPLQLFAYHVADQKGLDVDQPRNLAKAVTVE